MPAGARRLYIGVELQVTLTSSVNVTGHFGRVVACMLVSREVGGSNPRLDMCFYMAVV